MCGVCYISYTCSMFVRVTLSVCDSGGCGTPDKVTGSRGCVSDSGLHSREVRLLVLNMHAHTHYSVVLIRPCNFKVR